MHKIVHLQSPVSRGPSGQLQDFYGRSISGTDQVDTSVNEWQFGCPRNRSMDRTGESYGIVCGVLVHSGQSLGYDPVNSFNG